MKKNNKKQIKKVAPKKVAAKKVSAPKKVTPKKEVAKPAVKKPVKKAAPAKKVAVKKPAVKIVKTKETSKNKKVSKVKWVKKGPKTLPKVKAQPVKKEQPKLPAVQFAEQEAILFDLTKPDPMREKHPELFDPTGAPKPWGSIMPPFVPAMATAKQPTIVPVQPTSTAVPDSKPAATIAPEPVSTSSVSAVNPIWVAPTINTFGVSTSSSSASGWHTVVPTNSL